MALARHLARRQGVRNLVQPARRKTPRGRPSGALKLFVSNDGVKYDLLKVLDVPGHPNESTIRFLPDGEMVALVRREAKGASGWIGTSRPPYTDWNWKETKQRLGGPNFIRLPDGSLFAASRSFHEGEAKTVVARMTRDSYEPILTLPSAGDNSYPGLVWHDGLLWMSYYSSHEGKTSIYLAKVKLPLEAEKIGSRLEPFVDDYLARPPRRIGSAGGPASRAQGSRLHRRQAMGGEHQRLLHPLPGWRPLPDVLPRRAFG